MTSTEFRKIGSKRATEERIISYLLLFLLFEVLVGCPGVT